MAKDGNIVSFESLVGTKVADEKVEDTNSEKSSLGVDTQQVHQVYTSEFDTPVEEPEAQEEPVEEPVEEPKDWEKMFKDTQAAYTKSRQEIAALKTKAAALEAELNKQGYEIEPEVAEELEMLKYTDPEAWRQKLNAIEASKAKAIDSKIAYEVETERRTQLLNEYNQANPNYQINDYVAQNVLPGSFLRRLDAGELTFEGFIAEASDYLKRVKIGPGKSEKAGKPNPMRVLDGGSSPTPNGTDNDVSYQDAIF